MKTKLLFLAVALLSLATISCKKNLLGSTSYIRGGGGATGVIPQEPRPTGFKRNNGNGTCGGSAQIRVTLDTCPSYAPTLEAVYQPTSATDLGPALTGFTMGSGDMAPCSNNNKYISFCIYGAGGASSGNLPPANTLVLQFFYPTTGQVILINNEGDPYYL